MLTSIIPLLIKLLPTKLQSIKLHLIILLLEKSEPDKLQFSKTQSIKSTFFKEYVEKSTSSIENMRSNAVFF